MDAFAYRCRWMDIAQIAAIGFLIGSIAILSCATIYPSILLLSIQASLSIHLSFFAASEEPLPTRRANANMEWVVVLDGDTVYNIPPAKHPLTADEQIGMTATDRLDRRADGYSLVLRSLLLLAHLRRRYREMLSETLK